MPYILVLTIFIVLWDVLSVILFVENKVPFWKDTLDQNELVEAGFAYMRPSDGIRERGGMGTGSGSTTPDGLSSLTVSQHLQTGI